MWIECVVVSSPHFISKLTKSQLDYGWFDEKWLKNIVQVFLPFLEFSVEITNEEKNEKSFSGLILALWYVN